MDKSIDIAAKIRKIGAPSKWNSKTKESVYAVCCQICGGAIHSDDVSNVEYIKTNRGTEQFFHRQCLKRGKTDG